MKVHFRGRRWFTSFSGHGILFLFCCLLSELYLSGCAVPKGGNAGTSQGLDHVADQLADDLSRGIDLAGKVIQISEDNFRQRGTGLKLPFSAVLSDALAAALSKRGATITVQEVDHKPFRLVGTYGSEGSQCVINIQVRQMGETASQDMAVARAGLPETDLDRTWFRPKSDNAFTGKGTAIISHQCRPDENPCPPKSVLINRALRTAKLFAMRDLCEKSGIRMDSLSRVASDRIKGDTVTTKSHGTLRNLQYLDPVIDEDQVSIALIAEVD